MQTNHIVSGIKNPATILIQRAIWSRPQLVIDDVASFTQLAPSATQDGDIEVS
ncbi:hypothetical protein WI697_23435 [Tistrella mobilis]|uniref:hypothetical protein n=1 Tax=Tistrella mobilis TaxID=171437 RepID=UPI0031F6A8D9